MGRVGKPAPVDFRAPITDDELDEAFGLNRKTELHDGDLAYVRNKPGGPNITGSGTLLGRYVDHLDGGGSWQFFGSSCIALADEVEVVRRVTVVWA